MVENLILRIADQERRLNTITQKVGGVKFDHFGNSVTPRNDTSLNSLAFNNLTTAPVNSLAFNLNLRDKTFLPQIKSQKSFQNKTSSIGGSGTIQDQMSYLR